ncbi:MAG: rod shape-determining protein MreC [Patescibacteria group bacterium]|nr:rod shape-determining protein MreC [Patescibacteria group bacterium]
MNRRSKTAFIIFGALLALSVLHFTGVITPFENLLKSALSPLGLAATSVGTRLSRTFSGNMTAEQCLEKNVDLEKSLAGVSVDYVRLKALEDENEVLRKTLGYLQKEGYDAVMARIISRSAIPERSIVMIDKGAKDGLEIGMAVIYGDGIFVGKVSMIQERTATVTLISDAQSRVAVAKAGEGKLMGLVEGQGNWTAEATLIPQQESLNENEILVTSGTEGKIPANLIVGLINKVEGLPTDPFKHASIEPMAPLEYLEVVTVLRPQALRPGE